MTLETNKVGDLTCDKFVMDLRELAGSDDEVDE